LLLDFHDICIGLGMHDSDQCQQAFIRVRFLGLLLRLVRQLQECVESFLQAQKVEALDDWQLVSKGVEHNGSLELDLTQTIFSSGNLMGAWSTK
jgi:hypothetical protein